jgi:hypothetical protein
LIEWHPIPPPGGTEHQAIGLARVSQELFGGATAERGCFTRPLKRCEDVVDLLALPKHHETTVYSPDPRETPTGTASCAIVRASPGREQQTAATDQGNELTPLHVEQGASPIR